MSDGVPDGIKGLPENARRPLAPGEDYVPLVPQDGVPETTGRAIALGLVFCAIFSMAAAYLALKLGQGIEAAIPIAILAVGLSQLFARKSTILENVMIQSIGANSSHVVSGAVFTIPALYMLAAVPGSGVETPTLLQVVLVSFLGGSIGILFLIPLRHNFMVENHGVFPWPEATATTEILVTGENAGGQAKTLVVAALVGGFYDGLANLFRAMSENIRLAYVGPSQWLGRMQEKAFMRFDFLNSAATMGIGYIIGLRYTAIIAAGSFLSTFVLVPMVHGLAQYMPDVIVPPGTIPIAEMGPTAVFRDYVRIMGVGCIAGAGVMGVLSSLPSMMRSIASNMVALLHRGDGRAAAPGRTERSVPASFVAVGLSVFTLAAISFFSFGIGLIDAIVPALVGTAVVMVISFFFAPVAARAIATIGTNPISGMTMLTLLITGLVMLKLGFSGGTGMFVTMMVGGVVCTALAASGAFSTDLKIGHWIGATPARQIGWKFVGTFVAALFCGIAMYVMSKGGFGESGQYTAPQASAMRAILEGVFSATATPLRWYFFGLGVVLSLVLRIVQLPALGFALGMYLPIELNTPLFLGGILSHMVNKKKVHDTDESAKRRENKGILIASGMMAGGAIMGVIGAIARMNPSWKDGFYILPKCLIEGGAGEWLAIIGIVALCAYVVVGSGRERAHTGRE